MMRVITPPTVEPFTLAEVKSQLGIQTADTGSDTLITRRITEARQWAEDYMGRAIFTQTQEVRFDDFPPLVGLHERAMFPNRYQDFDAIKLPFPDLQSVVSVKYIDIDGTEQTITASDYVVDTYDYIGAVRPAYGVAWPSVRPEANAVRVQYKCGYGVTAIAAAKTITAATNATPGVFTSAAHGFADGDLIQLATTGMTTPNGQTYRVYAKAADTFQLANLSNNAGLSTLTWGTFSAGTATRVQLDVPGVLNEALILLIGHWTNNQPQSESGITLARVPFAVRDMLDKYMIPRQA